MTHDFQDLEKTLSSQEPTVRKENHYYSRLKTNSYQPDKRAWSMQHCRGLNQRHLTHKHAIYRLSHRVSWRTLVSMKKSKFSLLFLTSHSFTFMGVEQTKLGTSALSPDLEMFDNVLFTHVLKKAPPRIVMIWNSETKKMYAPINCAANWRDKIPSILILAENKSVRFMLGNEK